MAVLVQSGQVFVATEDEGSAVGFAAKVIFQVRKRTE
jgi:hypothetical protein